MPGFDFYFIPTVMNSNDTRFHNGILLEALKQYGHVINFEEVIFEGYLVLNSNSKVAQSTNANTALDMEDVEAYAQMANELFHFPVMYIEYSGEYTVILIKSKPYLTCLQKHNFSTVEASQV